MDKAMGTDQELLHRYAATGDEAAFAEVVRRQIDLVYGVALRVANGEAPLAEEVTQRVFTDLARKARPLSRHETLAGWLHTSARYTALKAIRGEQRRRHREQEASAMQDTATNVEIDWTQLRPVLDEAISRLHERERAVVVLRFFQDRSHREVGEALGLNENTARKCANRALEKLRKHFGRAGITLSSTLLATVLETHAAETAPAGLAEKIIPASLAGATAGISAGASMLQHLILMSSQIKILLAGALIIAAGLLLRFGWHQTPPTLAPEKTATIAHSTARVSPSAPPQAKVETPAATPAKAGSSVQPAIAISAPAANTELNSAVDDMIAKIETKDIDGFVDTYLAPSLADTAMTKAMMALDKRSKTPSDQIDRDQARAQMQQMLQQQIPSMIQKMKQALAANPGSMQEYQMLATALKAVKNSPQMNATGDKATYAFINTLGGKDGTKQVVMKRINDKWVFDGLGLAPSEGN